MFPGVLLRTWVVFKIKVPLLGLLNTTCRMILRTQKGTILFSTHIPGRALTTLFSVTHKTGAHISDPFKEAKRTHPWGAPGKEAASVTVELEDDLEEANGKVVAKEAKAGACGA